MKLKRLLAGAIASIAMLGAASSIHAAVIKTDIIMIVDESGSMAPAATQTAPLMATQTAPLWPR